MRVHEKRENVPQGFVKTDTAPSSQVLSLRLALVQNNPQGLEDALYSVSTPSSPKYKQYLSKEEVEAFVAPKQESLDLVNEWLSQNGLTATKASPAGDWLQVNVTVEKANSLFDAEFATFKHLSTDTDTVRTLEYSIPASLQGHLDFVHPTIIFPTSLNRKPVVAIPLPKVKSVVADANLTSNAVPSSCSTTVTPACLQAMYGIPTTLATQSSNKIAVTGYIDQYPQKSDLKSFLASLRKDLSSSTTFTLETLDDGSDPQSSSDAGLEANLDVQYTIGVASGVPTVFISVGDDSNDGIFGFLDTANHLLAETTPPHVMTTSYGSDESDISRSLANNLCNAYAQLGARGTSVFFSSGDGGVSGSQSQSCTTFVPTFPSGCPYVTSVGATSGYPETSAAFSSGGFSNYWGVPSYQTSAHSTYLSALGSTNSGKYNASGRGFPDIAAAGHSVEIYHQGSAATVDGTSCSSPIFASIITLLNDELVAAGDSPLGFLNPFLYSTGLSALSDITTGDNPGCSTNGFPAKAGWDPVTGLGVPNYAALRTAAGL
ncbi:serine protease S53 [Heterobasidion irregulare TC 32-1]|uniref:Serine protease S53 n=1 Tax=Heterobasidion irregulare (strain TC 32-1) TaxID=747525 RepID=W4KA29_HETIT|nr:serine protease S53 [Heterobasidion irregulare TC 32-1]ETW82604.1 serine protease S53 [Heterobasidion irregulare TC 32-1]